MERVNERPCKFLLLHSMCSSYIRHVKCFNSFMDVCALATLELEIDGLYQRYIICSPVNA